MVDTVTRSAASPRRITKYEQVLINYIRQIGPITDEEMYAILDLVNVRGHKKGKILLREGQVCNTCYFVMQGCVRQYYLVDGEEKTTNFYTEGQPVSSSGFPFDNRISKSFLVCNEDCILIEGRPEDEKAFFERLPRMETLNRVGVEMELHKTQEAMAEFIISSPEERYRKLLSARPELIDRVPQYQLASYLGVTPESLSRIRKRIMER